MAEGSSKIDQSILLQQITSPLQLVLEAPPPMLSMLAANVLDCQLR